MNYDQLFDFCTWLLLGSLARGQAWMLKRLVSLFNRASRRGHYPRDQGMRDIYLGSGIPLPINSAAQSGHLFK